MTKGEIINSIHIDKANLEYIAKTGKINGTLASELNRCFDQYAQQIVLDKLPKINPMESSMHGAYIGGYNEAIEVATKSITTREEVEKPYRELLEECRAYAMPPSLRQRINELLKR